MLIEVPLIQAKSGHQGFFVCKVVLNVLSKLLKDGIELAVAHATFSELGRETVNQLDKFTMLGVNLLYSRFKVRSPFKRSHIFTGYADMVKCVGDFQQPLGISLALKSCQVNDICNKQINLYLL